jgi:hypothetical protein
MSVTSKRSSKITIGEMIYNLKDFEGKVVSIGIWGKGPTPKENLAYRMAIHEKGYTVPRAYGRGPMARIPARPVFGTTFSDYKKAVDNFILKTLYPQVRSGKITPDEAIAMLGAWYEGKLKEQFRKKKFARLSPHYKIRPSGALVTPGSTPLIDTSDMRNAIKWRPI